MDMQNGWHKGLVIMQVGLPTQKAGVYGKQPGSWCAKSAIAITAPKHAKHLPRGDLSCPKLPRPALTSTW